GSWASSGRWATTGRSRPSRSAGGSTTWPRPTPARPSPRRPGRWTRSGARRRWAERSGGREMAVPLPPSIADRRRGARAAGKVAIGTGAGAGSGGAAAELLGREGAKVVVVSRTAASGEATAGAIRDAGGEAIYLRADVSQEQSCVDLVAETVRRF